jgi:hypothetical protein
MVAPGVFAVAALLHVLHGQFDIGPLFVYSAAVLRLQLTTFFWSDRAWRPT